MTARAIPKWELGLGADAAWVDVSDRVLSAQVNEGASGDPLRPTPGSKGSLQLDNDDRRFTPIRSAVYDDEQLAGAIPARLTLGTTVWWTGVALLGSDSDQGGTVTTAFTLSGKVTQAIKGSWPLTASGELEDLGDAFTTASGVPIEWVAGRAEQTDIVAQSKTFKGGDIVRLLTTALPGWAVERDGKLAILAWSALRLLPLEDTLTVADCETCSGIWLDGLDIAPDHARIVNRVQAGESGTVWQDTGSQGTWGIRPLRVAGGELFASANQPSWAAWLEAVGVGAPDVLRTRLPLAQSSADQLAKAVALRPGHRVLIQGQDRSLETLILQVTFRQRAKSLPEVTVVGVSLSSIDPLIHAVDTRIAESNEIEVHAQDVYPGSTSFTLEPAAARRPQITGAGIVGEGQTRYLGRLRVYSAAADGNGAGYVALDVVRNRTQALDRTRGDLAPAWETDGEIVITFGDDTLVVRTRGQDSTDPYVFAGTVASRQPIQAWATRRRNSVAAATQVTFRTIGHGDLPDGITVHNNADADGAHAVHSVRV